MLLQTEIEHGVVKDWSEMEKAGAAKLQGEPNLSPHLIVQVWHHTFFDALRVNPEDQPCIVSEALFQLIPI